MKLLQKIRCRARCPSGLLLVTAAALGSEALAGPRALIYDATDFAAPPRVLVSAQETAAGAAIKAPVFFVTIGREGDAGHVGKVKVEERQMTLEPAQTSPAGKAGKKKKSRR